MSAAPPVVSVVEVTINQLRTYCPLLASVAGSAQFELGLKEYNETLPRPAGFVVPLDQDSEGNRTDIGLVQYVTKRMGIIVEFSAEADRRGQDPTRSYDVMEAAIFGAVLNWKPVDCRIVNNQGYYFLGGRFLDLDRSRLFYRWDFALNWQITDDDGWHEPDFPLIQIELDIFKVPPQDMTIDTPPIIEKIDTLNDTPIPAAPDRWWRR